MIRTVCGLVRPEQLGRVLAHEHIITVHPGVHQMMGDRHFDQTRLIEAASAHLALLKEEHGLNALVDCTPPDLGRDIPLLQEISRRSGVHIRASTGFYYGEEPMLCRLEQDVLEQAMLTDLEKGCIGVIKTAVEAEHMTPLNRKVLLAAANVQLKTGLPLIVHTNSAACNGLEVLHLLLSAGAAPEAVTIGHVSDSEDVNYLAELAKSGCYLGYDRLYDDCSAEYIERKVRMLTTLCERGYGRQIVLSHDAQCYSEFVPRPALNPQPRFGYAFSHILPALQKAGLSADETEAMAGGNAVRELLCQSA